MKIKEKLKRKAMDSDSFVDISFDLSRFSKSMEKVAKSMNYILIHDLKKTDIDYFDNVISEITEEYNNSDRKYRNYIDYTGMSSFNKVTKLLDENKEFKKYVILNVFIGDMVASEIFRSYYENKDPSVHFVNIYDISNRETGYLNKYLQLFKTFGLNYESIGKLNFFEWLNKKESADLLY